MIPRVWASAIASAACAPNRTTLGECQRALANRSFERSSLDVLHRDEANSIGFPDFIDVTNVGMVQRRCRPRFPHESAVGINLSQRPVSQYLDRNRTVELQIHRTVDGAHAALAQFGGDLIVRDSLSDLEICLVGSLRRIQIDGDLGELFQKTPGHLVPGQQTLYLLSQGLVTPTSRGQVFGSIRALPRQSGLENVLHVLPCAGTHAGFSLPPGEMALNSQARATVHSRLTVRVEMPKTSAVSSSVSPLKYRSSTRWHCLASIASS